MANKRGKTARAALAGANMVRRGTTVGAVDAVAKKGADAIVGYADSKQRKRATAKAKRNIAAATQRFKKNTARSRKKAGTPIR